MQGDKEGLGAKDLESFCRVAIANGASDVAILAADRIVVEEELAAFCSRGSCENYGLAMSCPPKVEGPAFFRELCRSYEKALVLRITVASAILMGSGRREVMQFLHQAAAEVELEAKRAGWTRARAFAGGSCKAIFCEEKPVCKVLGEKGPCRHPHKARPSMSGFGINVGKLMDDCGWPAKITAADAAVDGEAMSWVAALVLLG